MRGLVLILLLSATSCGVTHRMTGTAKSESEVRVRISIEFPQCDHPEAPLSEIIECIKACMHSTITVDGQEAGVDILRTIADINSND